MNQKGGTFSTVVNEGCCIDDKHVLLCCPLNAFSLLMRSLNNININNNKSGNTITKNNYYNYTNKLDDDDDDAFLGGIASREKT